MVIFMSQMSFEANASLQFSGKKFKVYTKEVKDQNGKIHQTQAVIHPGAVVILPFLNDHEILLIKNYRPILSELLWELPAGTWESGEEPLQTAKRELMEETGYKADIMQPLLSFYSTPGFSNEWLDCFIAKNLKFVGQNLDETEEITVVSTPLTQAYDMIKKGIIKDAKTIAALLTYRYIQEEKCVENATGR